MVRSRKAAATACIIEISVVLRIQLGMDFRESAFLATCVPTSSSKRDLPSHMSEPDRVSNVLTCIGGSNLCLNLASEGSQHWRRGVALDESFRLNTLKAACDIRAQKGNHDLYRASPKKIQSFHRKHQAEGVETLPSPAFLTSTPASLREFSWSQSVLSTLLSRRPWTKACGAACC